MKLSTSFSVDHRSVLISYLPKRGISQTTMILPGAGCSFGCCCSSCGMTADL